MMIEREFGEKAITYCQSLDACAKREGRVDFIEVKEGEVYGYCLADDSSALFDKPEFLDDQILFVAKVMILANRWFATEIQVDDIPLLIGDRDA
jgi:hypothetical protein